jgi:hypothetical protein
MGRAAASMFFCENKFFHLTRIEVFVILKPVMSRLAVKEPNLPGAEVMIEHRQVKKVSDFMFMIVPCSCPSDTPTACDNCKHSRVEFKPGPRSRKSSVEIGYVSCVYAKEQPKSVGLLI